MSRALATLLCLAFLLPTTAAPLAAREPEGAVPPPDAEVVPGEVIVTHRAGHAADAARVRGLSRIRDLGAPSAEASAPALMSTGGRAVDEVLAELQSDPSVLLAEPNYVVRLADEAPVTTAVAVDDPKTADQYSLDQMRVRDAWSLSDGGSNLIAVLDTGVMRSHPDLAGRVVTGYDFVNDDTNAGDDNGHGTWVAGIIAANTDDGYGMAGISWSDKILPVKIMNREGTGNTADLLAGIRWSADKGADVINMSVGGFPYSQQLQDAVNYAWAKGAVLVGAAGNNRRDEVFYPASFDHVISVSATQPEDEFSNWSSYGPKVDVSAPGSSVMVTNCYTCTYGDHDSWGTHMLISGTSFATPNVAGVVALIRARYPSLSQFQVVERLYTTVDDLGYAGWDNRYGRGRVNALRALGGVAAAPAKHSRDRFEGNNVVKANAPQLALGTTYRPNLYPAGDIDVFTVVAPRDGRLDIRVTGIVDTRAWPWHGSGIPVDPVVELYTSAGSLIKRVDNEWESGTELAAVHAKGGTRIIVRVFNWYPNGNPNSYSITPAFVDTVVPKATIADPPAGATGVSRWVDPVVTFSEPVSGVSATTLRLRDVAANAIVPASVSYDAALGRARLSPSDRLKPASAYRVEVGTGIADPSGNPVAATTSTFTTGTASFDDTGASIFGAEIEWLLASGITGGCTKEKFCPTTQVRREQTAAFLARAMALPSSPTDFFADDADSIHEAAINRLAAAALTGGCARDRFCPRSLMTRAQMASFLARALRLPNTAHDYFTDDEGTIHENAINRLAAAGIVGGCSAGHYCPGSAVTREQMAAFLYRAFSGAD